MLRDDAAHVCSVTTRPLSERSRARPPRAAAARRHPGGGRRGGRCRAGSRGPRARSTSATARPSSAPVRGEHRAARVDDLGRAEEAQRAPRPGLVRRHHEDLVLDRARLVAEVEVARLDVVADVGGGVHAIGGPGRQRADHVGAVEGERARRLGEELVVTEQHPDPADRGVEGGEAVARGVGEALGGRQVDLALAAEHAVAVDADGRRVEHAVARLGVARAHDDVAGELDQARDLRAVGVEPGRDVGRARVRPRLAQVAAERRLGQDEQPHAALPRARPARARRARAPP